MKRYIAKELAAHEQLWSKINPINYDKTIHKTRANMVNKYAIGRVCEIGCGEGGMANYLFIGGHDVVAVDYSLNAIERAKSNYGELPIRFLKADATNLPLKTKSFETVTILETLEHTKKPERILIEGIRVASKRIIITVPNKYVFPTDPLHVTEFDEEILKKYLSKYVTRLHIEKIETEPKDLWIFAWGNIK